MFPSSSLSNSSSVSSPSSSTTTSMEASSSSSSSIPRFVLMGQQQNNNNGGSAPSFPQSPQQLSSSSFCSVSMASAPSTIATSSTVAAATFSSCSVPTVQQSNSRIATTNKTSSSSGNIVSGGSGGGGTGNNSCLSGNPFKSSGLPKCTSRSGANSGGIGMSHNSLSNNNNNSGSSSVNNDNNHIDNNNKQLLHYHHLQHQYPHYHHSFQYHSTTPPATTSNNNIAAGRVIVDRRNSTSSTTNLQIPSIYGSSTTSLASSSSSSCSGRGLSQQIASPTKTFKRNSIKNNKITPSTGNHKNDRQTPSVINDDVRQDDDDHHHQLMITNNSDSDDDCEIVTLNDKNFDEYDDNNNDDIQPPSSSKQTTKSGTINQQLSTTTFNSDPTAKQVSHGSTDSSPKDNYHSSNVLNNKKLLNDCFVPTTTTTNTSLFLNQQQKEKESSSNSSTITTQQICHSNLPVLFYSPMATNTTSSYVDNINNNNRTVNNKLVKPMDFVDQTSNNQNNLNNDNNDLSKIRLIKSQSLKFEANNHVANNQTTTTTLNDVSRSSNKKRTKLEPSKSLDLVDDQTLYNANSKLPRSLTLSCKKLSTNNTLNNNKNEPFFDVTNDPSFCADQRPGEQSKTMETNISRSSTASLSLVSNMNTDVITVNDMSDDESLLDLRSRLTAIDETSLSPLPSLSSIVNESNIQTVIHTLTDINNVDTMNENHPQQSQPYTDDNTNKTDSIIIHQRTPNSNENVECERKCQNIDQTNHTLKTDMEFDEESSLSLNSIEIQEASKSNAVQRSNANKSKLIKSRNLPGSRTNPIVNNNSNSSDKYSLKTTTRTNINKTAGTMLKQTNSKQTKPSSATARSLDNTTSTTLSTNRMNSATIKKSNIATSRNIDYYNGCNKNSSKPCSASGSRCTTPSVMSECSDSVCSSSFNANNHVKSNLHGPNKSLITTNFVSNGFKRPLSARNTTITNGHQISSRNSKTVNHGIKRSPTYTRCLNTQATTTTNMANSNGNSSTSIMASTSKQHENVNSINNENATVNATVDKSRKSFAKPTTSYLRKATVTVPRRPSSVLSNGSSSASSIPPSKTTIGNKTINSVNNGSFGPKRSPTITLLNTLASSSASKSNSNSATSSRRSSVSSPTKPPVNLNSSKKDILNQLQYYESLCFDKQQKIEKLKSDLIESNVKTRAFLVVTSFMINEYCPFDTPKLRNELLTAHQKCSTLHRDYELAKETSNQKQTEIESLTVKLEDLTGINDELKKNIATIQNEHNELKQELESNGDERKRLQNELQNSQTEANNEKQLRLEMEQRLEKMEGLLRTDKKYRELKEKVSNYEKEVDSLNVVVDMKTQRIRSLESEKMRTELELADYEQLKESYQRLQRENEALTEALGMKARKNAEQSRELDLLRVELKRETQERKRLSVRYDQLEFQLNESRDLLNNLSANLLPINEESKNADTDEQYFTPMNFKSLNNSNFVDSRSKSSTGSNAVRRLFSTPLTSDPQFKSRYHYQHQDPATFGPSPESTHRLPEVVLSSMTRSSRHHKLPVSDNTDNNKIPNGHQSPTSFHHQTSKHLQQTTAQTQPTTQDIIMDPLSSDSSLASMNSEERNRTMSE